MTDPSGESNETNDGMPFRLRNMELKVNFGDVHPIFNRIDDSKKAMEIYDTVSIK